MIFRAINSDLDNLNGLLNKIWTLGIVWEGKGLRRSFYFFNSFCFQRKWKTRIFTKNFACYATFQVHFLGKKEDYLTFEIIKIFSLPSSPHVSLLLFSQLLHPLFEHFFSSWSFLTTKKRCQFITLLVKSEAIVSPLMSDTTELMFSFR